MMSYTMINGITMNGGKEGGKKIGKFNYKIYLCIMVNKFLYADLIADSSSWGVWQEGANATVLFKGTQSECEQYALTLNEQNPDWVIWQNNKMIAEFMEWDEKTSGEYHHAPKIFDQFGRQIFQGFFLGDLPLKMYHQSFDWLFPVVEKINKSDWNISIFNNLVVVEKMGDAVETITGESLLSSLWKAVVFVIKQETK